MSFRRQPTSNLKKCMEDAAASQRVASSQILSVHWHTRDTELLHVNATILPWKCGQASMLPPKSRHCSMLSLQCHIPSSEELSWEELANKHSGWTGASKRVASVADTNSPGADSTSKGVLWDDWSWENKTSCVTKAKTLFPAKRTCQKNDQNWNKTDHRIRMSNSEPRRGGPAN